MKVAGFDVMNVPQLIGISTILSFGVVLLALSLAWQMRPGSLRDSGMGFGRDSRGWSAGGHCLAVSMENARCVCRSWLAVPASWAHLGRAGSARVLVFGPARGASGSAVARCDVGSNRGLAGSNRASIHLRLAGHWASSGLAWRRLRAVNFGGSAGRRLSHRFGPRFH